MATLSDILSDVGSILNQDPTLPTGTDLLMQINLANQALQEWAETYQWKQLRVNNFVPSITASMTSLALPSNFKKLMSVPQDFANSFTYEELRPEMRLNKDSTAYYCFTGGNPISGYYIQFNPGLVSGASIMFDYQSTPSGLATLQDTLVCPSKNFIVQRVLSKIYESRSDPRFPQFNSEAQNSLAQMSQEEAGLSGAQQNRMITVDEKRDFHIGG